MSPPSGTIPDPQVALLARLAQAAPAGFALDVFVVADTDGGRRTFRVGLDRQGDAEIRDAAVGYVQRAVRRTMLPYGPVTLVPGGHSLYLAVDGAALLRETQAAIDSRDADAFDPKADYARSARLLAARLSLADGTSVTLYQVLRPQFRFERSRLTALLWRNGSYQRVEPSDLLLFDLDFDVLVVDGLAFFNKKQTFEKAFGFLDELRAASRDTFRAVTRNLRIQGIDDLEAACTSDINMMAKMASIARTLQEDADYAAAMTMRNLIDFVEAHPHLGIELAGRGGNRALVFDKAPAKRFKIPKLLDDDFLSSELTKRNYEAGSKTRPV